MNNIGLKKEPVAGDERKKYDDLKKDLIIKYKDDRPNYDIINLVLNMKKVLILLLVCLAIITGCGSKNDNKVTSNGFVIVDVRTKEEYDESHIKGAINIPYDQIDGNTNLDKNKTIKVYCKSGKRSSIAYNTLKSLGYQVVDLGAYDNINMEKE